MIATPGQQTDPLPPHQAVDLVVRLRTAVERQANHPTDDADEQLGRAAHDLLAHLLGREPTEGEILRARGI
jgi:hypothetical protein